MYGRLFEDLYIFLSLCVYLFLINSCPLCKTHLSEFFAGSYLVFLSLDLTLPIVQISVTNFMTVLWSSF